MTIPPRQREHLVERAMMGEAPGPVPAPPPAAATPAIPASALAAAGLMAAPGRSLALEEMKLVQQQVLRGIEEAPGAHGRVVLVASARPGEGKSFIALNLAAALASNGGRPVVLVDADGRRGAISDILGAASPGLRNLTLAPQGGMPPLLATALERLLFLPYGATPDGQDSAPPRGNALAGAIARLARGLPGHVLVLDTPPILATSDAHALAAVAGQVVMVVGAEQTRDEEVEAALDMLEACPRLQLLLNRVRLAASGSFGADYGKDGSRAA
ncbi:P-loop NTPase [Pseudoroseomonas ludipueritiae]|uniref:P-loop NTPase n=1 Tax=Pseudoroseomonas ludipueritiae TaxID=198093 RepID=A0ABR7RF84_9PROT|nr:P-loop NTPase [Pseudoroseomonas ludipueritiae]MBC9180147.1 P-loop NTPase [Pseudoroseomonas ludipueritiae]MCG7364418.1 P-loop NTPase [Roseomonas sp. ACRSG]